MDTEEGVEQLSISDAVLVHDSIYFTAYDRQRREYQVYELDTNEEYARVVSDSPVNNDLGRIGASLLVFFNDGFHGNELSSLSLPIRSDVNHDHRTNGQDVDAVCRAIQLHSLELDYDLNYDDRVDHDDLAMLVEEVLLTGPGDANVDGVFDSRDQCPDTPKGVQVDASGCPLDSDGDGVADYRDRCPDTPMGTRVDASGCPVDSDGDGVVDSADKCPGTPKGTEVDASGCPVREDVDSDGDGVIDSTDSCPGTPKGVKTDARGCWVLEGVYYETNQATLQPRSRAALASGWFARQMLPTTTRSGR